MSKSDWTVEYKYAGETRDKDADAEILIKASDEIFRVTYNYGSTKGWLVDKPTPTAIPIVPKKEPLICFPTDEENNIGF